MFTSSREPLNFEIEPSSRRTCTVKSLRTMLDEVQFRSIKTRATRFANLTISSSFIAHSPPLASLTNQSFEDWARLDAEASVHFGSRLKIVVFIGR